MFVNFLIALNCVTPMFLTLCVGILLRASKIVPEEAFHHLSQISFHAFLPCLMFSNLYSADLSGTGHASIFVYLQAWVVVWFLLCTAVCNKLEPDLRRRGAYIQSGYRTNIAVVGVSLAQSMMGSSGVALMSMAVGLVVPTYNTLAVITLESCRGRRADPVHILKSILRNPLIIGCALGGLCLGLHIPLPGSVVKAVSSVGNAGSVTTLVALGASLKLGGMRHNLAAIVRCSAVRLVLAPLCALVPAILLGFRGDALGVVLVCIASPVASTAYPMALAYDSDHEFTAQMVVTTSLICTLTLFLWIFALKQLGLV